jgi:aminoglycoside phosphotransferase (APT) family kinase protein
MAELDCIPFDALEAWMDRAGIESGPIEAAKPLRGGTQNILVRFRRGSREFVLRRPPEHPRANSNETMRREARMLAALNGSAVPHPDLIAACPTEDVLGVAFYLMEPIEGYNPTTGLRSPHRDDPLLRHRMGLAMVEAIAALGAINYVHAGLADFGKPDGYLERQVGRWRAQLDSYSEHKGWPGPDSLPGVARVGDWLDANRPASFEPGIIHGDFHLSNVMFRFHSPELAAVVDWELTTIGDPLLDLGWLLATWPGPTEPEGVVSVTPWDGFPAPYELVRHYAERSSRDLSAIAWYGVLACYKLGLILEGTYARACAGKAPVDIGDRLHAQTLRLLGRAARWTQAD